MTPDERPTKREHEKLDRQHYLLMREQGHDGWTACACDIAKKLRAYHEVPLPADERPTSQHKEGKMREELRRELRRDYERRNSCPATWTHAPAIGSVGSDYRADCPVCGRRVLVTPLSKFRKHARPKASR